MEILTYILITLVIMGVSFLGMAIGVIVRNKGFTSCGRASMNFNGEEVSCPGCSGRNKKGTCAHKEDELEPAVSAEPVAAHSP